MVGLTGLSAIGTSSKTFSYSATVDNTILNLKTVIDNSIYESITFTYLTIGIQTNSVC